MPKPIRFFVRTIVAGVLFIAPLLLLLVLLVHSIKLVGQMLGTVATKLNIPSEFGLAAADVAALIAIIVVGFTAGLIAQTLWARRMMRTTEHLVLGRIPGYTLYKSVIRGAAGLGGDGDGDVKVALANIDDAWLLSFIVETHANGMLTVFVPSAPTPTAGSVYLLTEQQVKRLDVTVSAAMQCIMRLGLGSRDLLAKTTAGVGENHP